MKIYRSTLWILLLFALSVVVRIPTLNRPLSKHNEFTTAFNIRIMQIWTDDGLLKHYGSPIMNYPGEANKFINNETLGFFDSKGDDYYQSYPPFAFMFPYLVFRVLHVYPNVLPLEIFNLFLDLLDGLVLYSIVCLLFKWKEREKVFTTGIIAVALYLFNPATLWYHSNGYQTDMFSVTLWLLATLLFLKMEEKEKLASPLWLILLFAANFFLNYAEYLGVTFTTIVGLYCLYRFMKNRKYILPGIALGLSCIAALALTTFQYSHINGFKAFGHIVRYRYAIRGGYKSNGSFQKLSVLAHNWVTVGENYIIDYLPLLLLLLVVLVMALRNKQVRENAFTPPFKRIIVFFFMPAILHHVIFLNASLNDFLELKNAAFIVLIIAWFTYLLMQANLINGKIIGIITSITAILCVVQFYYINRPGPVSWKGDRYDKFKTDGEFIVARVQPDEVIFIQRILDEPQLILYAHRNMRTIVREEEAYDFLKTYGRHKGVIFAADSTNTVHLIKRIELR